MGAGVFPEAPRGSMCSQTHLVVGRIRCLRVGSGSSLASPDTLAGDAGFPTGPAFLGFSMEWVLSCFIAAEKPLQRLPQVCVMGLERRVPEAPYSCLSVPRVLSCQ